MPDRRARTTIATKEMLKAMWDRMMVVRPKPPVKPNTFPMSRITWTKKSSIMTAIVTSGMITGRKSMPSNVRRPRQR